MYHLILNLCLAADPSICAARVLPAGEAATEAACRETGAARAADWAADHADLRAGAWDCVATDTQPALDMTEIAPGVFTRVGAPGQSSAENRGEIANLSFVVGSGGVLVIDAGGTRAEGEALYAAIRQRTDLPIRELVLTHMHPDHMFGAEVFAEAGARIAISETYPRSVAARAGFWMENYTVLLGPETMLGTRVFLPSPDRQAPLVRSLVPGRLDAAALLPGRVSPLVERARPGEDGKPPERVQPRAVRPDLAMFAEPPAHTDNDVIVWDATTKTLFAGDMLFNGLTPVLDGSIDGWLHWLAQEQPVPAQMRLDRDMPLNAVARTPERVVPGHGPVISGSWAEASQPTYDYLSALRAATMRAIDAGQPLSRAVPAIVEAMQPYRGNWLEFDETTERNAIAAFKELEWQ